MRTSTEIKRRLQQVFDEQQALVLSEVVFEAYDDLVKSRDFGELKDIVARLAAAQERSEERLTRVETAIDRLTEAQARSEERLTRVETAIDRLAAAQERSEERLTRVETAIDRLTEAQARSEERLDRLTEAQARSEAAIDRLAAAQERTENALQQLTRDHQETRRQLGGLSMTVGYTLENAAYKALPPLLARDYELTVTGRLTRQYVTDTTGRAIEINILGAALKNGEEVIIIGEVKSQLSKKHVDAFLRHTINRLNQVFTNIFPLMVTHMTIAPDVAPYARQKGIALYYSYDF